MSDLWDVALGQVLRFGKAVQDAERLAELRRRAVPHCGDCTHWMKSKECPRETTVNGWQRGPSMNGTPCLIFDPTQDHLEDVAALSAARKGKP
jgi:hypothetical protein